MDKPLPDDFNPYVEANGDMKIVEGRDPLTVGAVVLNILVTIVSVGWVAGKNDQRDETQDRDIAELKAKESKDGQQDVECRRACAGDLPCDLLLRTLGAIRSIADVL